MASWREVQQEAPDFADRVRRVFDHRRHKTLATLRADGSPRISGIELEFRDGEVLMGMMPGSRKLGDVRRDPRLAVHGLSEDPPEADPGAWAGDAKLAGRAVEIFDQGPAGASEPSPRFSIDISEVVLTRVGEPADHLVIESWHPGGGLSVRRRQ